MTKQMQNDDKTSARLHFDGSINGRDSLRAEEVKARGVYRTLSLLRPHIEPNLVAEFDALMDRLVGEAA